MIEVTFTDNINCVGWGYLVARDQNPAAILSISDIKTVLRLASRGCVEIGFTGSSFIGLVKVIAAALSQDVREFCVENSENPRVGDSIDSNRPDVDSPPSRLLRCTCSGIFNDEGVVD